MITVAFVTDLTPKHEHFLLKAILCLEKMEIKQCLAYLGSSYFHFYTDRKANIDKLFTAELQMKRILTHVIYQT
jgi:hypothetical protein